MRSPGSIVWGPNGVDETQALWRSLIQEREMILNHRAKLREALSQIGAVAQVALAKPGKNEALLRIVQLSEDALAL